MRTLRNFHNLEPNRGHSFEVLVLRIDLYANRLKGSHAQNGFSIRVAKDERSSNNLPHKFNISGRDVHSDFTAISQFIRPLTFGFEANGFKVLSGDETIDGARINQEESIPGPLRFGRVSNRHRDLRNSHNDLGIRRVLTTRTPLVAAHYRLR